MCVPKTSDHIQINIRMPNSSQEPPASSKAPNEDLKDMDVLCTFKIEMRAKIWIMGISKTSDNIQIKIKMPTPQSGTSSILQSPKSVLKGHRCSLQRQS